MLYKKIDNIEEKLSGAIKGDGNGEVRKENIIVLGGAGFLGSVLTNQLVQAGHEVTVLDKFLYDDHALRKISDRVNLSIYRGDIRDVELLQDLFRGKDTVINLAAIVGDEACRIDQEATIEINTKAAGVIASTAREAGVKKLLHASTCSTYGKNGDALLNENSPLLPLSLYAQSKVESEKMLWSETGRGKSPACCIFRFSTLFGYSFRPRFDLVVNTLTGHAWNRGALTIFGGDQWRPLLHVSDAARAVRLAAESEPERIAGKIYNTGSSELNMTIMDVGNLVRECLPETVIEVEDQICDERNYRVDFSRIRKELGFVPGHTVKTGILELVHALENGDGIDITEPVFSNYRHLSAQPALFEEAVAVS
ncbi:MAG: NAD-dependent epimerase/dehydratase family protein [Candidatus Latescibacteria bacterium]|nr:NAD-dependent epimerase/dehydratase family protein [bacterium]MBD3423857.1 NAD-dependent epimerase/dehydratase family protein [Candidatus Latescibacterota bacterium]